MMIKQFFDRRGEKRSLSGTKTRLFNEVYRKISKSSCKFIFFSFLKLVILLLLLWAIYKQLFQQQNVWDTFQTFKQSLNGRTVLLLSLCSLLTIPNFMCETQKWRILMYPIYPLKWWLALKAVLVGTTMAIFTPNRVGEYVGRVLYIPKKYVLETIGLTIVGSLSQMMVILFFGILSILFLKDQFIAEALFSISQLTMLTLGVAFILGCLSLIYYKINVLPNLLNRLNFLKKYLSKMEVLRGYTQKNLLYVQAWAVLKYVVFSTQFVLLLLAFNIPFSTTLLFSVMFIFLIQTIVPSVALIELGVRTNVALVAIGLVSSNSVGILSASLLLWIINLMVPALIGAMLLFKIKNTNTFNQ